MQRRGLLTAAIAAVAGAIASRFATPARADVQPVYPPPDAACAPIWPIDPDGTVRVDGGPVTEGIVWWEITDHPDDHAQVFLSVWAAEILGERTRLMAKVAMPRFEAHEHYRIDIHWQDAIAGKLATCRWQQ